MYMEKVATLVPNNSLANARYRVKFYNFTILQVSLRLIFTYSTGEFKNEIYIDLNV